jgi:hypothetical protein
MPQAADRPAIARRTRRTHDPQRDTDAATAELEGRVSQGASGRSDPDASARALSPACRRWLRERLARSDGGGALPFLEAVVVQAAFPLGLDLPADERVEREREVAGLALELLLGAEAAGAADPGAAAARLRRDPALLAAFFQNVDLLYRHAFAGADAVSLLVMRALEEPRDDADGGGSEPFAAGGG